MARKPTGAIVERTGKDTLTYRSLRFTAYGKRRFVALGAVSRDEAEKALRGALADVERGQWKEPDLPAPEPERMPTFHEFAEQWWVRNQAELRPSTCVDYRWRLEKHLLPFFAGYRLHEISFDVVERYITTKLAETEALSPRSINMTLTLMAAIFEGAVERELIARNPAKGKSRRVRKHEPRRSYLDTAEQITALLDAAAELDARAREDRQHVERRAIVAMLTFAGLRIGELCGLRWRDVDIPGGWLHVTDAKTDAGVRRVKIRGALRDELLAVRSRRIAGPYEYVFATSTGGRPGRDNLRNRVLTPATKLASERLVERGLTPLPAQITPHSLRRTFASVLCAIGESIPVIQAEMGHTDPTLTLRIYAQVMRRDNGEKQRLRDLVDGVQVPDLNAEWAKEPR